MSREIIIIGGGIAGLSAAAEIRHARVTLLEAKERFGGRIQTLQAEYGVIELGAEFVHGRNPALLDALNAAQLKMRPVSDCNQVFQSGHLHEMPIWEKFGELTERIDIRAPDQSFLTFLDQQRLDEATYEMMLAFAEGFNAADANRLSAHSLRRAEYSGEQMDGEKQARLDQGYSALVDFFVRKAREAGAELLNDAVVRAVRWRPGHVEVETVRGQGRETFSAEAAIITLPLGVLKARAVEFDPPLLDKDEAIRGLAFGNVVKIALGFRKFWWPQHDFGFIHALNEALPTWWSNSQSPILTGWTGGPKADALLSHSPAQLETAAIEILSRLFAISTETIRSQLISSHTRNWAADPFVRGAYSFIPVNGLFLPKQLGAPVEDTLFFAGEATATDAQMGTVFAALENGIRVARELQRT